ncbi:MAG TPA: helix-turn-helix transcriptional regulator [Pilimelia sp.]|nr:helix-turn-helix transcriptional regulator [Pilimelia sp.]
MSHHDGPSRSRTLAEKLNYLFQTLHPGQREPFSSRHVASAVTAAAAARGDTKYEITHSYISLLRSGERDNPTLKHLEALADFFGVPVSYFFADDAGARRIEQQVELLVAMADAGVREVAFRAAGLSPESLRIITAMMRQVRKLEGLEQDPPHLGPGSPS